jgi:tetratricopeptide (TPR) repeat protein
MDSCFSCFSRLFNDTMEFAYDQGTLGRYYRRYITLMRHWHKVLPKGTILDLPYEDMVTDTEMQARRVLKFVGLPWDDKCLEFYKNDRLVKTASVAQVRKPIYKSSVARWKHFARHLQPLLDLVREFRDVSDDPDISSLPPLPLLNSDVPADLTNQCLALQGKGDHQGVISLLAPYLPKFGLDPTAAVLYHLHGISLYRLDRFEEARASYERSLEIQPNHPACYNSLGFLLQDMGRMQEALDAFEKAIQQSPDMAMARLNLGMAQLKLGDFENGLENYEARWTGSAESVQGTFTRPNCPLPMWDGQGDTADKSLLVITEQGFGDTFQFSRYLNEIAGRFKKVGFVCSKSTRRLMEWAFNDKIALFTHMPQDYATWDYQCALMSLPRACKTRIGSIPLGLPYLKAPKPASQHWRGRLEDASPGRYRVGIAWAGRKAHQYDARRSMTLAQILPLLETANITWVSLQKWAAEDARPEIPENIDWIDWTEELIDFADTAALVKNLDLVISIDSSMVHLAGGLNTPVWMLNRFDSEWRWLESRADSPWYPNLKIYNQPKFADWYSVVRSVMTDLKAIPVPDVPTKSRPRRQFTLQVQPKLHAAMPATPVAAPQSAPQAIQHSPSALAGEGLTPEQALQLASQHQAAGRLTDAENLLRQILKLNSQNAHALHLLGVVTYQAAQPILALDLIRQAIAIEPTAALFESNLAEMSRQQGRIDEAIEHGRKAAALDPTMASAHSNLGIALFDAKQYDEAEASHMRALAVIPNLLQSLNNLGSIERARGNKIEALVWYRKALAVNPDFLESLTNIGAVMVEEERPEEAIQPLLKVLQVFPNSPEALCNLGLSYYKQDDPERGEALLRRSLQSRPGYPEALVGLARVLQDADRLDEAENLLLEATETSPEKSDAWCQLGAIYTERGEADLADAAYLRALAVDAKCADALTGLANLKLEAGKIEDAVAGLHGALQVDPDNLGARFHLTQAQKVEKGDSNLAVLESKAASNENLSVEKRISLHYALGKAYDDLKEYDKAFPQFIEGAKLKRSKISYSADADDARTRRVIEIFSAERYHRLHGNGSNDATPIFVLGMPRSGTTLTEQIIASHPSVQGAGELRDLLEVAHQPVPGKTDLAYPENLLDIDGGTLSAWGSDYIARLRKHSAMAQHITDKMPANYMALGLIPLILPNAKIVHVKRNPVDTCVSCFTRLFNRHQDATYDLAELGRHYMNYERLMRHWRSLLPAGSFLEVQYENIVADMEGQARRLIDYVGLDWNDACLDFHKNERNIRTASVTQVRQPIYSTSVERWRNYQHYLGPLLEQLKPLL